MPMPLCSFFDEYDFGGKTIILFSTHGGSRFSDAINTIRRLEKQAAVFDGYSIARDRVAGSKDGIQKWIDSLGMKK
ncbi:MAG: flavodoxin [Candidatus Aphodosoma sp.]